VDGCPVCGEPFYWHVVTAGELTDVQRIAFLQMMEDLVEGNIDREFMTHGEQLWLPYSFWQFNPDGSILDTFAWIRDLELVQHPNPQKSQYFQDVAQEKPVEAELEESSDGLDTQDLVVPEAVKPKAGQHRRPPTKRPEVLISAQPPRGHLFGPIMLGLFFVLMALSYLSLLIQKHRMASPAPVTEVHRDGG